MADKTRIHTTMKDLKQREMFKLAIVLIVLVIFSSSCKKDDEDNSGYYGKWIAGKAVPSSSGFRKVDYFLTISKPNKFNESFYVYTASGYTIIINYISIDGSIIVLENQMQFNAEKISISNYNLEKKKVDPPLNVITNSQGIENTLNGLVKVTSGHNAKFSLNGNEMTLSVDYDRNGNYLDYDEILIYTRQ